MKKMRRMIPALCMLLVSAIMLSTASYAWFTMNEQVTATGMQVQAKATGSLVISKSPLTYNSAATEVDLSHTTVTQLSPISLVNTTPEADTPTYEWQRPEDDAVVHSYTGRLTYGKLEKVSNDIAKLCYLEEIVYIGTAGDTAINSGEMTIDLSAIASAAGEATNAYAVAVYIAGVVSGEEDAVSVPATDEQPAAVVYVDTNVAGRNTAKITLDETNYVPSIVGIGAQNKLMTGLKVVLRVFVEGNLDAPENKTINVPTGTYTYASVAANTDWVSNKAYFYATGNYVQVTADEMKAAVGKVAPAGWLTRSGAEGSYTYASAEGTEVNATTDVYYMVEYAPADLNNLVDKTYDAEDGTTLTGGKIPEGWFTRTENKKDFNYNYVRSEDVPSSGSTLAVKFSTALTDVEEG